MSKSCVRTTLPRSRPDRSAPSIRDVVSASQAQPYVRLRVVSGQAAFGLWTQIAGSAVPCLNCPLFQLSTQKLPFRIVQRSFRGPAGGHTSKLLKGSNIRPPHSFRVVQRFAKPQKSVPYRRAKGEGAYSAVRMVLIMAIQDGESVATRSTLFRDFGASRRFCTTSAAPDLVREERASFKILK